jgi:nucleoside-diphosphate-sugar epimerase
MNQSLPPGHGPHILVTGGAGYLGSVLVPALLAAGYEVSVVDLFWFGKESLASVHDHPYLHLYEGDISNLDALPNLFSGIDAVVHLASVSNDPTSDLDPNTTIRINYLATTALAKRARAEGVQQFIFASSCSVYGANSSRVLDEQSHTGPVTLYALTKLASEREILELSSTDFRVTVVRFSTLFGLSPRMRFDLAVNAMTKQVLHGKSLMVNGAGLQYRPFVHVRDATEAIMRILRADPAVVRGHLFNIGANSLNFTIKQLAEEIQRMFPAVPIQHRTVNEDVRSYRVRFKKAYEVLHFTPRQSIADAVNEISAAYEAQQLGTMEEEQYYNLPVIKRVYKAQPSEVNWAAVSSPTQTAVAIKS